MPWHSTEGALVYGRSAAVLDFPEYLEEVARYAHFERSACCLRELVPVATPALVEERRRRVAAWLRLFQDNVSPDLGGLRDLGAGLERSKIPGAILGGEELHEVGVTLRGIGRFADFLAVNREAAPVLQADWGTPVDLGPLASEIERCIDEEGEIRDTASPRLRRIRAQIKESRDNVRSTLDGIIRRDLDGSPKDIRPRIRSGRLVLPVKREQRSLLPGIIHDESGTGRTLFVEPLATVELNNRVTSLLTEQGEEEARILMDLTWRTGEWSDEIRHRLDAFHTLDISLAVARAHANVDHCWAEWADNGALQVNEARHPLLARYLPTGCDLVPLTLGLPEDIRLFLVTGPNTGGKTVLLKTLGLMVLKNQCGFPLSAGEGSYLPCYRKLFVDIGDEQSIHDSQSTFSAHLGHLTEMVEECDEDTLILVDEIGDGTDPQEGAALAQAAMSHWIDRGATAIISTHFGVLKGFAQETPGAVNASMDFDPVKRCPLYTLRFGVPGSSRALATARRLGMDTTVLAEAERLIGEDALNLESLLERLERETRAACVAREEGEKLRLNYKDLESQYAERMAGVKREVKEIRENARREGEDFLIEARREIENVVRELRENQAQRDTILDGRQRLAHLEKNLDKFVPQPNKAGVPLSDWRVGDIVTLRGSGRKAEILDEVGEGRLRVALGEMAMVVPKAELIPHKPAAERDNLHSRGLGAMSLEAEAPDSYRLDLRGMTVEEALEELDMFLDGASLGSFQFVEIIHGKGTGALRRAVTDYLSRDRRVNNSRLADQNQGGSGATVATLRSGRGV
ncbi:MAG: hypothetical protein GY835_06070 [bacterium]|nr:hypothetical protein [bacterium]